MNGIYKPGDIVLGKWTLTRFIGEGSFGKVFEAERKDFGRTYKAAIKIVTIPQSQSEIQSVRSDGMDEESVTSYFRGFVEEMVDEFDLMEKLKGTANVVGYEDHEVIQHTNQLGWDILIRMELLTPLLYKIQTGSLPQSQIIRLGMDLCRALELCHNHKILHRDIKPENIFISDNGDYKLGDFGIARTVEKTTGGLSKKGTYTYMAPEVYKGEAYGFSADLYSLGIVLYWLSNSNRAPFFPLYPKAITYSDRETALRRRMSGEPIPAPCNVDSELSAVILKACAYAPKDRYASPRELHQALQALYRGESKPQERIYCETEMSERTESIFSATPTSLPINKDDATAYLFEPCQLISYERPIGKEKKKTNRISFYAVVGMLCVTLTVGGLYISGTFSDGVKAEIDQTSEDMGETESNQWSEWLDELPSSISAEKYEIEESTLYRSREKETITSSENVMDGWEQYDTSEYGAWSKWSTTPVIASDTRKIEEATQYRYRELKTMTSTSDTQSSILGSYGPWSDWQISPVTSTDSRQVEMKIQYSYRTKTITQEYGRWSDWSDWQDNSVIADHCTDVETRNLYYYERTSCPSCGKVYPSNIVLQCSECGTIFYSAGTSCYDSTQPSEVISNWEGTGVNSVIISGEQWFQPTNVEPIKQYRYRTRELMENVSYSNWTEYTDTKVTESSTLEVRTKTLYRYRDLGKTDVNEWGPWSDWSTVPVSETSTRQVETQEVYRYADKGQNTVYHFWRWGKWTEFSETKVEQTENVEVEQKNVYRYREK